MNTSILIDMPEVALFDSQELTLKLSNYIKSLASKLDCASSEKVQAPHVDWRNMEISSKVKAMTFDDRVDLGTTDYNALIQESLEEKYL